VGSNGAPRTSSDLGNWQKGERRASAVVFVAAVILLAMLCAASVGLLSSARAYVGGESFYAKGQKNAVRYLRQYVRFGDEADYRRFSQALAIPLGDRQARLELEKPAPDYARVRNALLQGGNDAADLTSVIVFYRLFHHMPMVSGAVDTWAVADLDLVRLSELGDRVHGALGTPGIGDAERLGYEREMNHLADVLDAFETKFARQLGIASRWVQALLLMAALGLAIVLITAGLMFGRTMWHRLARSQQEVEDGNTRWALAAEAGQFGLAEWQSRTDTVLLDSRARSILELDAGSSGVFPAHDLQQLVRQEDRQELQASTRKAISERAPLVQRFRIDLPSGGSKHLEVDGRAFFSESGVMTHAVGLVRDVTKEVTTQAALLEEDAAQRTYQAKREFLSRVSHELRTPLNAVIGFSDLMRTDSNDALSASQKARLDRVVDGGQYLLRLVNDLLDVARLEVGEMSIALANVRLAGVLRSAVELLEPARVARGITIDFEEPAASLFVVADPVRLKQVFVNVLSNAIKYNRPDGVVFVSSVLTPTQVVVTVRDEGVGMTPQQQRDLFIPFRRLGEEPNATEGAGLGLVISRHLAERLGGSLDITSAPRKGTTVTVRLNRDLQDGEEASGTDTTSGFVSAMPGSAGVVVYIEDDPVNILLMEEYFALTGDVQLMVARDGQSGLELVRSCMPNLVLLDMQLPDMNGLDVLDRLRADPATSDIRVVALSADAMPAQVTEAIARGAEAYWTKPLSLSRFKRELPKFLR
jgi:signal transduction histidine kinase/CheY-like chemotaxis protein